MLGFTPVFELEVDGQPVSGDFFSVLISATLVDNEGDEVDTLTIRLDDRDNAIAIPRKGAVLTPRFGYAETGVVDKGRFTAENVAIECDVTRGHVLVIEANAADLRKGTKGAGQKAYEQKTFREIVETEAKAMGFQAVVDADLASHVFDWRVRWNASRIDFLTRLADEIGGIVKPAGGKLIVQKRGGGKSASGKELPPLLIVPNDCSAWRGRPVGRLEYGKVISYWTDPKTGEQKKVTTPTGQEGPEWTIREPYPNEREAKKAGEAQVGRLNRGTGEATFTCYGRPEAMAGQPVQAVGFRDGLEGDYTATTVTHSFGDDGYITEIECKSKDSKGGKKG